MARYEHESETALLRAARRDPAAFTALYRRLVAEVYAYLRGATHDPDLARDLTAETFARTLESVGSFRGVRAQSGRVYVFRVAQRLVAEHARSRGAELAACRRLEIALPSDDADGGDALAALQALSPDQREAVSLRVLLDREYAEVAARLGVSEATARKRVSRGLQLLHDRMEER
ncbi:MAG TPA: RNA polymerase sigma factor [Gaiellales bacterium]